MKKTVEEILNTIKPEKGEIFVVTDGKRMKLADCKPEIDIVQKSTYLNALNANGYVVRRVLMSVVLCLDNQTALDFFDDFFSRAERFELSFETEKNIGEYVKITLKNLRVNSIDLYKNEWEFFTDDKNDIDKLLTI